MQNQELPTAEDDDWHRIKLMIRNLKRAVLPSTHAHQILDEDKEFLKYLWKNNVTPEARKAILLLLGQAVKNVDLAFEKWRTELQANARSKERRGAGGASDSRERLQLVPNTWKLLKAAELANPDQEWSIKLPREVFKLALEDFVLAARGQSNSHSANKRSVDIAASRIYTHWETFDAWQQVKLLDLTVGRTAQIDEEWNSKQGTNQRKHIQQYYPELQDYQRALENVPAYEDTSQIAAVEDPHFHNSETTAATDQPFQAQQRDSTHATVLRPYAFNNANGSFTSSQSYGASHHSIPTQQSQQFNFASSPGSSHQQQFHHHSLNAPVSGFDSSFAAALPSRSFATQSVLPHHQS